MKVDILIPQQIHKIGAQAAHNADLEIQVWLNTKFINQKHLSSIIQRKRKIPYLLGIHFYKTSECKLVVWNKNKHSWSLVSIGHDLQRSYGDGFYLLDKVNGSAAVHEGWPWNNLIRSHVVRGCWLLPGAWLKPSCRTPTCDPYV